MNDNMVSQNDDQNSNTCQGLGEVALMRDKSFTLGKAKATKSNKSEKNSTERHRITGY